MFVSRATDVLRTDSRRRISLRFTLPLVLLVFTGAMQAQKDPGVRNGCSVPQPDFDAESARHNIIFRIPTPTFGNGLIEAITDSTIRQNLASDPVQKGLLGIKGHVNTNGNDGAVTRFGWKAQNK